MGFLINKIQKGELFFKQKGIPFVEVNTKRFCRENGFDGSIADMPDSLREDYFLKVLENLEKFKPDLIILSGFMLAIIKPLLGFVPIINVHPADLSLKDGKGIPLYRGDDAVTLAIEAGEKYTASTIHVVTKDVDCGEIICISEKIFVEDGVDPKDHQEKMKTYCDGPAYQKALSMICNGEFLFK